MKPPYLLPWKKRTYVMGIINLTPDSFSGDGLLARVDPVQAAVEQALQFIDAGADILDLGGESTRPGHNPVSAEEELSRILPVVKELARLDLPVPISVDTYKAGVADAALQAGAHWVNDVWGLTADPDMGAVVAQRRAAVVLMHNASRPKAAVQSASLGGRYTGEETEDIIALVKRGLEDCLQRAVRAGIPSEHILLDPGIGFGKTIRQNLELINRLDELASLGFPLLLGPSRKSFIGYTLNLPYDQRLEGTLAAVAIGVARGADVVRVHDVRAAVQVVRMADAIVGKSLPAEAA